MPGNWWPVFNTREMTSGFPVCFWHEYRVGNDAGGEGWGFVDGIRRSGMARGRFVIAKRVDNGLSLSEFPTWWSGMELIVVTGETGWLGEKKWEIGTGLWRTPTRMFGEEGELTWPVPQWRLWGTLSKPLSAVTPWVVQRGFLLEYKETMLSQASACEKWADWNNGKAMTFSSPRGELSAGNNLIHEP